MKNLFEVFVFDADETLLDFYAASRGAFYSLFIEEETKTVDEYYIKYKSINNKVWEEYTNGKITANKLKTKRFKLLLEDISYPTDLADNLSELYLKRLVEHSTLLNGTIEVIQQLHLKGKTIAIATNGLQEVQYRRIQKTGLDKFVHKIFISEEIGIAKPNFGFFEYIHLNLGSPDKNKVLFVGDNPNSDIVGAKKFGYSSCLLQRRWHPLHETCGSDFIIESLAELL